jgi:hypothetical protein
MHSDDLTSSRLYKSIPIEQLRVQSLHDPQSVLGFFILNSLSFDIIENKAPSRHKYLQKNRSTKKEPAIIKSKKTPPKLKNPARFFHAVRFVYIPNMFQGLTSAGILTVPSVHTNTAINKRSTYLKYLSTRSVRSLIRTFFLRMREDIDHIKSPMLPNAHKKPQKNLPITTVSGITASNIKS